MDADTDQLAAPKGRRWFQFRLRTLFGIVTLCCVGASIAASQWRDFKKDWEGEQRVKAALVRKAQPFSIAPHGPAPLRLFAQFLGAKHFDRVVECQLYTADDGDLQQVCRLSYLEALSIPYSDGITDSGIASVSRLETLQRLRIGGSLAVTSKGLAALRNLSHLKDLDLTGGRRTGFLAIEVLSSFADLRSLSLSGPIIDDESLSSLEHSFELTEIKLDSTLVSGVGFEKLRGLRKIADVDIFGGHTSDAGLKCIAGLPNLRRLWIGGASITDNGIATLGHCTSLHELGIACENVTDDGVRELLSAQAPISTLDLRDSPRISDKTVDVLVHYGGLRKLYISGSGISATGAGKLVNAVPNLSVEP